MSADQFDTMMELLREHYSQINPISDSDIKTAVGFLGAVFEGLPMEDSNRLFLQIYDLCEAYQHHAFREGIRIGAAMMRQLCRLPELDCSAYGCNL